MEKLKWQYKFNPIKFWFEKNHLKRYAFHVCLESENQCTGSYGIRLFVRIDFYKIIIGFELMPFGEIQKDF